MELNLSPLNLLGEEADAKRPLVIAGPCSAETEEQVMCTATQLARKGIKLFRAGIWKPRTKPGGFEGIGEEGLPWLNRVQKELGMKVCTEVATHAHVEAALNAGIDLLWIGARTVANPFAMQEIADALKGHDVPVLVKNPVNPDLELWIGGLERINQAGITRLGVIHRGFSTYEKRLYRNRMLKDNVPGMFEGTYMITGTYWTPQTRFLKYKGRDFAETHGMWEVEGDFMGGPFVSHAFYSPDGKYIVVADAWVYAPKYDKRQYLRQTESLLYSWEWVKEKEN